MNIFFYFYQYQVTNILKYLDLMRTFLKILPSKICDNIHRMLCNVVHNLNNLFVTHAINVCMTCVYSLCNEFAHCPSTVTYDF